MAAIDVLGLGAVAVDDLVVADRFPEENTKMSVREMHRLPGGLAGTALVAASRMGARSAYAGTLGDDDLSRFVLTHLSAEGVDVSKVVVDPAARPFHSVVIVADNGGTRTILYSSEGVIGAHPFQPTEEVIRSSGTVLLDTVGMEGMVRAAGVAKQYGIPRIGDYEHEESDLFSELLQLTNHLIVPLQFAIRITGRSDPYGAVDELWSDDRDLVAVTNGEEGSWYRSAELDERVHHQEARKVEVVDTTGCGDVFHGVYAYALAAKLEVSERIEMASAAAALKATRRGGQTGIPYLSEVRKLINRSR